MAAFGDEKLPKTFETENGLQNIIDEIGRSNDLKIVLAFFLLYMGCSGLGASEIKEQYIPERTILTLFSIKKSADKF